MLAGLAERAGLTVAAAARLAAALDDDEATAVAARAVALSVQVHALGDGALPPGRRSGELGRAVALAADLHRAVDVLWRRLAGDVRRVG